MSYKGYDDVIISVGEEMNNKGLFKDDTTENDVRMYLINKGEIHIPRLGKITFDEAKYICSKFQEGYRLSQKQGMFNTGELKELAKIYIESGQNLFYVDYLFLGDEYIKSNERLLEHFKKYGKSEDVISYLGVPDLETAIEMIKKSSNLIGYILPKVSDDDKSKCVDAFIDAGHNIFCLPKELIKQKHVESYFNAEKGYYGISSFIDVLDYTAIKKFINRDNTILAEIETVAKYFNQVYTKSSKKFTLEHSMLCELLFGKIDLGNKELEKAITLLNIDKIYIAYNEYRIDREIDKRYDEDDY
jgi:hypothetical protein